MKKSTPYILGAIILIGVILILFGRSSSKPKQLNERMTFRRTDKIPYGTFVAYQSLQHLFPAANISVSRNEPGLWDSISITESDQALVIISPRFFASEEEMQRLVRFASYGNDVFISTSDMSYASMNILRAKSTMGFFGAKADSMRVSLESPPFEKDFIRDYPGKKFDAYLYSYDSSISQVLGRSDRGEIVFIKLTTGTGNIYLHLAPVTFTNYFILHKNNNDYYENALSVISPDTRKIVWDEYFLTKRDKPSTRDKSDWLGKLFEYPSLRNGLLTALFLLLIYVLLEMRRKQRIIPVMTRPKNDSLDFVKTIGRLYHDKKDHKDLSRKMASYFLEHVRNRYKLLTNNLDADFVMSLHQKSGYDHAQLYEIITFINSIDTTTGINENELHQFYKQLESFYKST